MGRVIPSAAINGPRWTPDRRRLPSHRSLIPERPTAGSASLPSATLAIALRPPRVRNAILRPLEEAPPSHRHGGPGRDDVGSGRLENSSEEAKDEGDNACLAPHFIQDPSKPLPRHRSLVLIKSSDGTPSF